MEAAGQRISNEQQERLARCVGAAAEIATLPPEWYTDETLFEVERDVVFRSGWIPVGRSDRWSKIGSFVALEVGDVPTIVVRGEEGLSAFANTCSHRGVQLIEGEGSCSRMRCPFHAWTYALDGRLVGAPEMHDTPGFDRADFGLHKFGVAERAGFVFVNLAVAPPPIDDWLDGFGEIHSPWPLDSLVTTRRREFTVECNWKTFCEVFNEYYHLPYVHPVSIEGIYLPPKEPEDVLGAFATQFGTTTTTAAVLAQGRDHAFPAMSGLGGEVRDGVRYTWLFPNIVTAIGADCMWIYEVTPDGPHRSRCAQLVCFPKETAERADFANRAESYYERFDVAIAEDIPVLERQQRGLQSPYARQGRLSHLEPCVGRFASWYAERLLDRLG